MPVLRGRGSGLGVGGAGVSQLEGVPLIPRYNAHITFPTLTSHPLTTHHPSDVPCLTGKLNRYFTVSYPHSTTTAARVRPQRGGKASSYPPIALARAAGNSQVPVYISAWVCVYLSFYGYCKFVYVRIC